MTIWYILCSFGTFFPFWCHVRSKIWQPWSLFLFLLSNNSFLRLCLQIPSNRSTPIFSFSTSNLLSADCCHPFVHTYTEFLSGAAAKRLRGGIHPKKVLTSLGNRSGANPTITSYNATISITRFENTNHFFRCKNALA
jgi:hypothetical protein